MELKTRANEDGRAKGEDPEVIDENKVRKKHLEQLHNHMDQQLHKRRYRLIHVASKNDTTRQWDLIAAAMEQANIDHHQLTGREANKNERAIEDSLQEQDQGQPARN